MRGLSSSSQAALNRALYGCFMSNSNLGPKPTLKPGVALAIVSAGVTIAATLAIGFALAQASQPTLAPAAQDEPLPPGDRSNWSDNTVAAEAQPRGRREHDDDGDEGDDDDEDDDDDDRHRGETRQVATLERAGGPSAMAAPIPAARRSTRVRTRSS